MQPQYAMILAAVAGLAVTALSGLFIVPLLRRLKFGQTIKEIGPTWHKEKQGTPTMGGLMMMLGGVLGVLAAYPLLAAAAAYANPFGVGSLLLSVCTALAFGAIGFADDWLKVVRKQNLGLRARVKIVFQSLVAIGYLAGLHLLGKLNTVVRLPFLGAVDLSWAFYPIAFLLILLIVNATNLTDGLDGLCTSVTFWAMLAFLVLTALFYEFYLGLWASAMAGVCVGFLFWNFYPAKVFMGDTGSLFLGGVVVTLGFGMGRPDVMVLLSVVYIIEALSVVLQIGFFKLTRRFSKDRQGRRIFKMSPIHHHFEMMGWSEIQIDMLFNFVALMCAVLAYLYAHVLG